MLNEFKQENVDSFIKNQMLCKEKFHEKNKLEYYCQEETCKRYICQKGLLYFIEITECREITEAQKQVKT
jgi:hypothetical protein